MNTHEQSPEPQVRRIDRILAYISITSIGLAVICFIAVIAGTAAGADMRTPLWAVVSVVLMYGLPLGIVAFFALLITNMVRRSSATKASGRKS